MMPVVVGMLSPSESGYVGPVGPVGMLSPSDSVSIGMMALMGRCPHPILLECCFRPFLLGYRSQ